MYSRYLLAPIFLCLVIAPPALGQSARSGIGATPYADTSGTGVTFRTWAPNATSVAVKGSFNGWGSTTLGKDMPGGSWNGYWSVDSAGAKSGDEYKFIVNGTYKKDPRARRVVNSAGNCIVYDPDAFNWGDSTNFNRIWRNDLVIYQLHVGTFNAESWLPSTFDQCLEKLPYLKALGISAVKLMPVNEFPGDRSWGYNPSDPYAIEASFGGPDGLKRFVKTCHENGLAVILDVVHNHYGPSDLEMWQYDGWSENGLGGIYFYNDWKADTDWGQTRPDYGRAEVRDYIKGQIRMFLAEYQVDGFRWDSVYNIRHASGSWNQDGSDMLADINAMTRDEFGDAYRIAEDHAFNPSVNFESQWDHAFLNDIRYLATTGSDADRDMNMLAGYLSNGGFDSVRYAESHDSCGDLNDKHRLPRDIDSGDPQSYWAKKRALLAHGIALISPGIPMIFAGSEMHEDYTFSNDQALRWELTNSNAGIVRAFSDLIHLRRNAYGNTGALKDNSQIQVRHNNNSAKVVGVSRRDELMLVVNASATDFTNYDMAFPSAGTWYCLYNSDSQTYDSLFHDKGPAVGAPVVAGAGATAALELGAYSIQMYAKTPIPADSAATFDPPNPDGCGSTVTITYDPGDGPLTNATAVSAYIGRNNWQNPSNHPMSSSGGVWTLDYTIPELTYELNLSFTDGADTWDNNEGLNWSVPVANCGDLPSTAAWSPYVPQGCIPLDITYHPNGGPLMGASNIALHIGRNDWSAEAQSIPMSAVSENEWTTTYSIPDDTWQVDFVFNGLVSTNQIWDNNNQADWHVQVQDCLPDDQPYVTLSHPAPATNVATAVTSITLQGSAHLLQGHLSWTNRLNGMAGTLAYATNWNIASVPLAEGVNVIRVSGTNSAVNPNDGAWDSPTNATYASTWANGANGGQQFGSWIIKGAGASMASSAMDSNTLSLGPRAWALQADGGGLVEVLRPFAAGLQPGDTVQFVFENGGIDGGAGASSIGVEFQNRFGQRLTQFRFDGGTNNFVIYDSELQNTGLPWSNTPKTNTLEILSSFTYRLTVNGQAFEGTFADASTYEPATIRFWNWNAGGGPERKLYIGDLSVSGEPLPVFAYSAETAVTRAPLPYRLTESVTIDGTTLVASVSSLSGIPGNVWGATVLANGAWNWSLLPTNHYAITGNTVVITPVDTYSLQLFSIGQPGGSPP
ncbi:MAG: carbohydrate-binding protein [Kiritimatiellae bacterium]|nr:carbohydrate-binding protein [Kiritimatiellia bacterium]